MSSTDKSILSKPPDADNASTNSAVNKDQCVTSKSKQAVSTEILNSVSNIKQAEASKHTYSKPKLESDKTNLDSSLKNGSGEDSCGASSPSDRDGAKVDNKSKDKALDNAPHMIDNIDIPDDPFGDEYTDRRLWVGNLDSRMTEFAILKIMQKYGSIRKMDFVYHKSGPDKGKSKGYCFVSFQTWEAAEEARKALDGKFALGRPMYVKWARGVTQQEEPKATLPSIPSVSSHTTTKTHISSTRTNTAEVPLLPENASKDAKIRAIEAKLKLMQSTQNDFSVDSTIRPPPGWVPLSSVRKDDRSRPGPYNKKPSYGGHRNRRR